MRKLLLAMGSDILMDEGVSFMLARDLQRLFPDFTLQHLITGGMELTVLLAGYDVVVILDTLLTSAAEIGRISIYNGYDPAPTLHLQNPHDASFMDTLRLAAQLDHPLPEKIMVLAIGIRQQMNASSVPSRPMAERYGNLLDECSHAIRTLVQPDRS